MDHAYVPIAALSITVIGGLSAFFSGWGAIKWARRRYNWDYLYQHEYLPMMVEGNFERGIIETGGRHG